MASKVPLLIIGSAMAMLALVGCGQEVVKAGVPPPSPSNDAAAGRKNDTVPKMQNTRGGLDLPRSLPKGPY